MEDIIIKCIQKINNEKYFPNLIIEITIDYDWKKINFRSLGEYRGYGMCVVEYSYYGVHGSSNKPFLHDFVNEYLYYSIKPKIIYELLKYFKSTLNKDLSKLICQKMLPILIDNEYQQKIKKYDTIKKYYCPYPDINKYDKYNPSNEIFELLNISKTINVKIPYEKMKYNQ